MSPTAFIKKTSTIVNIPSVLFILIITFLYCSFATLLLNYHLVLSTLSGTFTLQYKVTLLFDLLSGIVVSIGWTDTILLMLNGFFVGLNFYLLCKTLRSLKGMGKVKVSVGGATIIGLVAAGCGACGFTLFSLLGLSVSLSFLPLHGMEIHIVSLGILIFSSVYMVHKLTEAKVCRLY